MTCSVDGCAQAMHARSLCHKHYKADRAPDMPACSVDECGRPSHARGLCCKHYATDRASRLRVDVSATCPMCGNGFTTTRRRTDGRLVQIYCSGLCKRRERYEREYGNPFTGRSCVVCGVKVETRVGKPVCPDHRLDPRRDADGRERRRTLRKYGITEDDWTSFLSQQGDRCAICRTDRPGSRGERWHIDHDHATGKVRGLLCNSCNIGLGHFKDDPDLLLAAGLYIERTAA